MERVTLPVNLLKKSNITTWLFILLSQLLMMSADTYAANYTLPSDFGSKPFSSCSASGSDYTCSDEVKLTKTAKITLNSDINLTIEDGSFIAENNFSIVDNGFKLNLTVVNGNVNFIKNTNYFGDILANNGDIKFEKNTDFTGSIHTDNGNIQITNKNSNFIGNLSTDNGNVEIEDGSWVEGICSPEDSTGSVSCSGVDANANTSSVDHYQIRNDGSALTCSPESILIAACKDSDCSELYSETVSLTLGPSGWVGGDTLEFSGSITADLRNTTAESIVLEIVTASAEAVNGYKCVDAIGGNEVSCNLQFFDSGFAFSVPTQISGKTSDSITLKAVSKDDESNRCVPSFTNRTENVNFWSDYVSPTTGSYPLEVNGTELAQASPGTAINLSFDENGESTLEILYKDAGQLQLHSRFIGQGEEGGLELTGNSTFVTRPAGICVYSDAVAANCSSGDGDCSAFVSAGTPFSLHLKGVSWQADTEVDTDFCDTNSITPNYQHSDISIVHNLIAPLTGVAGSLDLTTTNIVTEGKVEFSQIVSEVGVFTFTANPISSYLGLTDVYEGATFTSANIGRFVPDYFEVDISPTSPTLAESCVSYTYLGEPFDWSAVPEITIRAMNGLSPPAVTENYEGDFFKLNNTLTYSYSDASIDPETSLLPENSSQDFPDTADCNGSVSIFLDEDDGIINNGVYDGFSFSRPLPDTPVAPFEPNITMEIAGNNLTDSDGVCHQTAGTCEAFSVHNISGIHLRHGRALAEPVFGPPTATLTMPFWAYWYDGASWLENSDDDCSSCSYTITPSGISVTGAPVSPLSFTTGAGNLTLTPAANSIRGTVSVECDVEEWLEPDPVGVATFGIARGNDRIINWQEIIR